MRTNTSKCMQQQLQELHEYPLSGKLICQGFETKHEHCQTTEGMSWPTPGKDPGVTTIIVDHKSTTKSAGQLWTREKEEKVPAGVWMW